MGLVSLIQQQLSTEVQRYSRTPYGKLAAVAIYFVLFTQIPPVVSIAVPFLLDRLSPALAYTAVVMATSTVCTLLFNLSMYFVYTAKLPFFEQYRVNRDRPWPWEENPEKWRQLLTRSVKIILLDIFVVTPLLLAGAMSLDFYVDMDVSRAPSFLEEVLPQMVIMHCLEDLFFFTSHWALHQPLLYRFHKVHHEYTTTVSVAGLYSHLVEFLIANSIPAGIYMKVASLYAPLHVSTAVVWLVLRLWDAFNGHCGYVFSWAPLQLLPFCANDDFHDFHHSHNTGNYGSQFRFLDTLFGTSRNFKAYKQARAKQPAINAKQEALKAKQQ